MQILQILHIYLLPGKFFFIIYNIYFFIIENIQMLFRGNSLGSKAFESYIKLIGHKYLKTALGDFIQCVVNMNHECEVRDAYSYFPCLHHFCTGLSQN